MYIPDSALTAIRKSKISLCSALCDLEKVDNDELPVEHGIHSAHANVEDAYNLLMLIIVASEDSHSRV